jgi:hypothetical protein
MVGAPRRRNSDQVMFSGHEDATPQPRHLARGLMGVVREQLADKAFRHYLEWRDESTTVESAYRRWINASAGEDSFAFAAYGAALDREERAAALYQSVLDEGERLLSGRGR